MQTMNERARELQAYLFAEGGALPLSKLAKLTNLEKEAVSSALDELAHALEGSGLSLIVTDTEARLAVAPAQSELLKEAYLSDLGREIGEAGLEVLAIVLYKKSASRSEIDHVRGVNASSSIRALLSRGLIERAGDGREYRYRPASELLAHLGVTRLDELPEFGSISEALRGFESRGDAD